MSLLSILSNSDFNTNKIYATIREIGLRTINNNDWNKPSGTRMKKYRKKSNYGKSKHS